MHKISVGAIFHNEAPYLKEWLDHYINRGVDHFYLINDSSNDNFKEALDFYLHKGYVTLFNVVQTDFEYVYTRQEKIYNHFFLSLKDQTDWFLICDIDEYVWSPKYLDFKNAIDALEKEDVSFYKIPMILFGSNGYINQPPNIVNSFTKREPIDKDYFKFSEKYAQTKIISKIEKIKKFYVHWHISDYKEFIPYFMDPNSCLFRLNHYRLQSEEKWRENLKKRDVNNYYPKYPLNFSANIKYIKSKGISDANYRNIELFHQANMRQNIIDDLGLVDQNIKYNL